MDDAPPPVFKYLSSARAQEVLSKLLIRFSQVSVLNDTRELRPPLSGIAPRSRIEELLSEKFGPRVLQIVENASRQFPSIDRQTISRIAENLEKELIPKGAEQVEEFFPVTVRTIYEKLDANMGILSLTEIPTNALMWSHYAEGGRGILVEFSSSHPWFWCQRSEDDDFHHLRQVKYPSSRPPKFLFDTIGEELLYTKDKEWEYEREWRIIRSFSDAAVHLGPDSYGKNVHLFAIPPDCVSSVVLGYRASPEAVENLNNIVAANPALSHVHFVRAQQNQDSSIHLFS
jgi:Protein of unknown function (DUF2971)